MYAENKFSGLCGHFPRQSIDKFKFLSLGARLSAISFFGLLLL